MPTMKKVNFPISHQSNWMFILYNRIAPYVLILTDNTLQWNFNKITLKIFF
uniref:Uncharacterized protein n=1 Tax=Meloidogyne enterolobii TaxID=390850 RepID=A0A6V7WA50_MELEN|nr:unnamed protein product [Meloidogyne enterolobii]